DAFDRFGSRLYAASGQIDAEPFHHARGRGARLRPECAAELAQAHADLLRQTLDGEPFGDVIASIANGSGNPVILWRQIDGSCELRLSAMAAMVDDEALCHAFGDGKTMDLLDQSHREMDPGRDDRRGRASESLGQRKSRSSSWPNDREIRPCGQIVPALACPQGGPAMSQPISVVVPVYDGVTQLDFTGPHQFLSRTPDLHIRVASLGGEPVTADRLTFSNLDDL